jgi:hypothetical protein
MDWEILAPMIGGVAFMLITALTILLWPLSRRLAHLVEVIIQEKSRVRPESDARLEEVLLRMDARLARLEEERQFTSALLSPTPDARGARPPALPRQSV